MKSPTPPACVFELHCSKLYPVNRLQKIEFNLVYVFTRI